MSNFIHLKDNKTVVDIIQSEEDYDNLTQIANYSIEQLLEKNKNILVFPHSLELSKDRIDELELIHLTGSRDLLKDCCIKTGNLMGFIGVGRTKISITSRFAKNTETSDDYFLHYLLQKVLCLNLVNFNYSTSDFGEFDLLIYMFPMLLKKAFSQGLIKQYITNYKNDSNVKGTIDVTRHIQSNIPFNGRIAYKNRDYSNDNSMTELIRHTIELIKTKENGFNILSSDFETANCVRIIIEATPSYNKNTIGKVINDNLRPIKHPYYTEYETLQKLCLQILRYEKVNYSQNDKEAYGVLFDGAWLWEEFLATFLTKKPLQFIHPENKLKKNGILVYTGNVRYPDFYRGHQSTPEMMEGNFVLDAKYKHLDYVDGNSLKSSFSREDLHQLITYLYILPAKFGALIYPLDKNTTSDGEATKRVLKGYGGSIWTLGIKIPQNCISLVDFSIKMDKSVREVKNIIKKELGL